MGMVMPVVRAPLDRISLNCEGSKSGKRIFDCFWRFEAFMGELAMEGGSDAQGCQDVAPEAKLEHSWAIAEWSTESQDMSASDDAGHDLVFSVHLRPTFVHSWEDLETPEFVISEGTQLWNFEFWPRLTLVLLPHNIGESRLVLFDRLLLHGWFKSCDAHHRVSSCRHQNRRILPLARNCLTDIPVFDKWKRIDLGSWHNRAGI